MAKIDGKEPLANWRLALANDMDVAALGLGGEGEWVLKKGVARHPSGTWARFETDEDGAVRVGAMGFGPRRGQGADKSEGTEGLARVDGGSMAAWWKQNQGANLAGDGEFAASCAFALELFRIMWEQPNLRHVEHSIKWELSGKKGLVRMPMNFDAASRPSADLSWKRRPALEHQKAVQAQIEKSFMDRGLDKGEIVNMGMDMRTPSFARFATRFMGPDHWEQWAREMERSGLTELVGEVGGCAARESKSL